MHVKDQTFNIQFVANITGINPHTIRAWEKRYNAIIPQRDHNGRRLYSNADIDRLSALNKLVKMGNSISDIATLSFEKLSEISEQYVGAFQVNEKKLINFDYSNSLESIYMGMDFFKLDVINHELNKAANDLTSVDFALNIIAPIISKIRVMKKNDVISKDKRIQLYLILKSHLIKKIYQSNAENTANKKVVVAAASGDLNELGSMLATILFIDQGYEVDFLGGDVEGKYVGKICSQFKPDLVFIGLNYSHDTDESNTAKSQYLETINQYLTMQTKVMVGAYDVCFNLPSYDHECILEFKDIYQKLAN